MKRLRSNTSLILFSIVNAIVLMLVCYFMDNWSFSLFSGPSVGQRIEQVKTISGIKTDRIPDDYVFINTAYDRQLVTVLDEYGFPEGEIDITHRGKLAEFINSLDGRHKYVMMDILISDRYLSDDDSLLVASILNQDRIGIARSATADLLDERLIPKAGYIDYSTDIFESNFVKYEFLKDGKATLPYMAFIEENPEEQFKTIGPFYFRNGQLARKSLILRFPIRLFEDSTSEGESSDESFMQEKVIYNLGADILDMGVDIPSLVKDKIVVIGDFSEDDFHDTYMGPIAGPVINLNALEALRNRELEIPWWIVVGLFVLYFAITYLIFKPWLFDRFVDRWMAKTLKRSKVLGFLLSFAGYSVIFFIIAAVIYLTSGYDINVFIPSIWFTILSGIKKYISYAKN